jgi:hypothetical protein
VTLLVPARLRWGHEVEVLSLAAALRDVPGRAGRWRQGGAGSGRRRFRRGAPRRAAPQRELPACVLNALEGLDRRRFVRDN